MPNVLVEAMAAGLPIACSNRGPMPEVLGSEGNYFDPEAPAEIADVVERMIDNVDLRREAAMKAQARVATYDWEECTRATAEFLADVAREFNS